MFRQSSSPTTRTIVLRALAELRSSASAFAEVQGAGVRPGVWTLTEW